VCGVIEDATTGQPIAEAGVYLGESSLGALTDQNGAFVLEGLREGSHGLRFSHVGYQDTSRIVELTDHQRLDILVGMKERIVRSIEEIIVAAESPGLGFGYAMEVGAMGPDMPDDIGRQFRHLANASAIHRGAFCGDPVVRGVTGEKLNIQVDNGLQLVGACPNRMDPPTAHMQAEDLRKIEVVKGPYTVRFGPNMSGLVNMVMQEPVHYDDFALHSSLEGGYESVSRGRKTRLVVDGGHEQFSFYLNGGVKDFQDYEDARGNVIPANFDARDYSVKLGYSHEGIHRVQFSGRESRHADISFPSLPMDAVGTDTHIYALDYMIPDHAGILAGAHAKAYVARVEHEMSNLRRSDRMMDATTVAETENAGARLEMRLALRHVDQLFIGSDLHRSTMNGLRTRDGRPGTMMADKHFEETLWPDAESSHTGFFTEVTELHGNRALLSAGLRYDLDTRQGRDIDPLFLAIYPTGGRRREFAGLSFHLGAEYQLPPGRSISLRLGRGVRSPGVKELFINRFNIGRDGYEYLGNPDLRTEKNQQIDLSLAARSASYSVRSTVFYSRMRDFISARYDASLPRVMPSVPGVKRYVNIDAAIRIGGELEADLRLNRRWTVRNSLAYTYGQNTTDDEPLMEIPPLEYKLTAQYDSGSGDGFIRLDGRIVAKQTRISTSFRETPTPGFQIWGLSGQYAITRSLSLIGGVENLFNQWYYEHLNRGLKYTGMKGRALYEPGRNVHLSMRIAY